MGDHQKYNVYAAPKLINTYRLMNLTDGNRRVIMNNSTVPYHQQHLYPIFIQIF
jgi:hypothetical protein